MLYKEEDIKQRIYDLWLIIHKDPDLYSEDFKQTVQRLYEIYGANNIYKEA
jgi:hypothetical protein